MDSSGGTVASSRRHLSSKPPAPPPPQKIRKCDPVEDKIHEGDVPQAFSVLNGRGLLKPAQEQTNEPQGLVFRKLDGQTLEHDPRGDLQAKPEVQKGSLAHSGETLLATFYGMLYTNDGAEKEWRLEVDGFIPVCFVQVHGNANKPFRIIAVEKSRRIMEYLVTVNTTCARNSSFVKWQDGASMFGVRFAKEEQAEQFYSTVKRMASTLAKAAHLFKQPERKAVIGQISDPEKSSNVHHSKVSLMIKLPDKQTTIMSVPGLLTMSELFEMICQKEHLNPAEHQLSLPRTGARKVTFDSGTAVGLLKIREVAILRTMLSGSSTGSGEVEDESFEDFLDIEGEENKILHIILPTGIRKSYRVSLDMTMKQLVMRVCSRESLNPRNHSLQYIDFKHEFLDMASTVNDIEVNQVRLMDKKGRNISRTSITDDDSPSNSPNNIKFRRSSEAELESPTSPTEDKENRFSWHRSKSLNVLTDDREVEVFSQQDVQVANKDLSKQSASNGTVPTMTSSNSSDGVANKKPPVPPLPYSVKTSSLPKKPPRDLPNVGLKDQNFSPIKKDGIISVSTPDLTFLSSKSGDSPGTSNIKTSTPEIKRRRRVAPPPPARPAVPKALFAEGKPASQTNGSGLPVKKPTPAVRTNQPPPVNPSPAVRTNQTPPVIPTPAVRTNTLQSLPASDTKVKPSQKRRPAPPRPARPPPPHPSRQSSTESKDSRGSEDSNDSRREVNLQLKQEEDTTGLDRGLLSLDLKPPPYDFKEKEEEDVDLRGIPIFIPPPPPDELPPPLEECETPVGPLTEYETDILEGSGSENFPVTVNGFVGIGKYLASSQSQTLEEMHTESDDRTAEIRNPPLRSNKEAVLPTVPEHVSFPVVPPPPLYSEPPESSRSNCLPQKDAAVVSNKGGPIFTFQVLPNENSNPGLADIPPPLLEAESASTSQDSEEKDRDSGFDQSPEVLSRAPPVGPSEETPVQRWEDPDPGSSLDAISVIPPPMDFATATRPLTPPCEFANLTVLPPEGYDEEQQPEKAKPRKKLNVSEDSFPWMNEPQAPINATVLPAVSECTEKEPELEILSSEQERHVGENVDELLNKQECSETIITQTDSAVVIVPITGSAENAERPPKPELKTKLNNVFEEQEAKPVVAVSEAQREEVPNIASGQTKEVVVAPKVDMPESYEKVIVVNDNAKEQSVLDEISKPVKPETKPKPMKFAKEAEVQIEPNVGVQKFAPPSVYPFTEVARQDQQVKAAKVEPQVKPEKPETQAKPVKPVKEVEVTVDIQHRIASSFIPNIEAAKPEPPVESAVKPEMQVKPEKVEAKNNPVTLNKETEVKVEAPAPSSYVPPAEIARAQQQVIPVKPDVQVKPEQPETRVKPVTFAKEAEVKAEPNVDVQQFAPSSNRVKPQFEYVTPVLEVKPEKPEKQHSLAGEEVVTPQVKHEAKVCIKMLETEGPDFSDSSSPYVHVVTSGNNSILEGGAVTIINVGEDNVVVEDPVTPETKPTRPPHDKLKDLEERLLELDKEPVPSSSNTRKPDTKSVPQPYQDEVSVQSKDPSAEDIIVAQTKQVEFSSYEKFEELFKLDNEEKPMKKATSVVNKDDRADAVVERQHSQPESSTSGAVVDAELHLDLSSLRQSPEPPRPPSSSPPATTPGSYILPSPRELLSDRSTESGISVFEEPKSPSDSVEPNREGKEKKPRQTCSTQTELQGNTSVNTTSVVSTPQTGEKPTGSKPPIGAKPVKLQRPLSMPSGIPRDFQSGADQERRQSATESDSRKSSSSDSTGVSSSSVPSSPVESGNTTNPADLPKPPPFTVPPLRRYSDLASDLSFISSAAKAAGKAQESDKKTEVPPKPANLVLKRSSVSVEERPRSWVGPETNNNKRSTMWPSTFKPVSFEVQGKKVAPVAFDVKSFTPATTASTSQSTTNANLAGVGKSQAYTIERKSSPTELEKSSKKPPLVPVKPPGNTTGNPAASVVSPIVKQEAPIVHQPVSSGVSGNPPLKKIEPLEKKYEIIYTNNSSESQSASKDPRDKGGIVSRGPSKDLSSSTSIRDQIMRDATGSNRVTRPRPQSAFVGGSKFQILPAENKPSSKTGASWADVKKLAALQSAAKRDDASWTHKKQANEPSKPDVPHNPAKPPQLVKAADVRPQQSKEADNKPQPVKIADIKPPPVKPQPVKAVDIKPQPPNAANVKTQPEITPDSKPPPAIVMRTKTGNEDLVKRHSLPAYIIEGADRKPAPKTSGSGGQFHFIMKEVKTDTTVVPQGVVAAMKALREKKGISGGDNDGEVDLEHTQWV